MLFFKILYRINSFVKKVFYKIVYGNKIKFGKNVVFRKGFSLVIEKNATVEIGDGCFFNNYCSVNALNSIKIGKNTIFGENVKLYDHDHSFKGFGLIKNQGYDVGDILIKDNCWICSNVIILKNTVIEDGSVVAAMSVVSGNVLPNKLFYQKRDNKLKDIKIKEEI